MRRAKIPSYVYYPLWVITAVMIGVGASMFIWADGQTSNRAIILYFCGSALAGIGVWVALQSLPPRKDRNTEPGAEEEPPDSGPDGA